MPFVWWQSNEETPLLLANSSGDNCCSTNDKKTLNIRKSRTTMTEDASESSHNSNGSLSAQAQEHQQPMAEDVSRYNKSNLILLVCTAAATAATLGYDVGIMAAAIQPLEEQLELSGVQKEIAMGSLNFVAAFGAFLGGYVADAYGRKRTILLCCWLFIIGTIVMALSINYSMLLTGRVITGLGVGVAFVAAPCYITEVAPTDSRGQLNTVFDISINGGILSGYITGFVVQLILPNNWRLMLGAGLVLPIIVLFLLSRLPESPRWFMLTHRKEEAETVLLHLGNTEEETMQILQDMQDEIDREEHTKPPRLGPGQRYAIQLGFWQQITGTEAVLYYSADYLQRAGLQSPLMRLGGNVFVGICKLLPECIAMQYIDTAGRRPLLFGSATMLFLSTLSLAFAFSMQAKPIVIVVLLCAVMASFSAGLGPFTFLSASENLAMSERAIGMTYCSAANRITSGTVAMTAVTLTNLVGDAGLFAIYATAGFLSLFFYWRVPETAGVSLEELASRSFGSLEPPPNQHMEIPSSHLYARASGEIT